MNRLVTLRSLYLVLALWGSACGGEPTESPQQGPGVDRETFIATYVDLRTAVIRSDSTDLSDRDRARILQNHGVTEDDLLGFAEAHGDDVAFMRDVWDEVEERLDAVRLEPGSDERR